MVVGQVQIIVEGMTASGKSTTVELLARRLGLAVMPEEFRDQYDLLRRFHYERRWAFPMQLNFLVTRFAQYLCASEDTVHILDRSIFGDKIYAALYHRLGYFSDAMFQSYLHLYNSLLKHLRMPKLLILLKCPLPEILRRIVARGREDEIRAGEQYWCDLYTAYDTFLDVVNAEKAIPNLLILDTATTNLVHNEAHIAAFLDEVRSYLQREDEPDLSACCPPPCGALA